MMRRVVGLLIATVGLSLAVPAESIAYERTKTCGTYGVRDCRDGEVALPLYWLSPCVKYVVNEEGTDQIEGEGLSTKTYDAIRSSFQTWNDVSCSQLEMVDDGTTPISIVEGKPTDDRERLSLIIFRDENWESVVGASKTSYALTSVSYLPDTGQILDSDIEINSDTTFEEEDLRKHINVEGEPGPNEVDLQNTLTHEIGHFLGLAHSLESEATMFSTAPFGETRKRTLSDDDIAGICDAYGFEGEPQTCDDPGDFEQDPPKRDDKGCCATTVRDTLPPSLALVFAASLLLTARLRRRK